MLALAFECPPSTRAIEIEYRLFEGLDPLHRGLVRVESPEHGASAATVLGGSRPREQIALHRSGSASTVLAYLREGIWHIWIGIDHVLFLVCLLLPAVLPRSRNGAGFRETARRVAWVITAFTAAHSLTLGLGIVGWLELPPRFVESAIAASIVIVAAGNVIPRLRLHGAVPAFGLGLLHGLGFASVLADLFADDGRGAAGLAAPLLGFNLGVELGQLAIVAVFLPVAFRLRNTAFYRSGVVPLGSAAMAAVAAVWLVERAFQRDWISIL